MAKMNFSISHEGHTNNMRSEKNIKGDEQDWETTAYSLIDFAPASDLHPKLPFTKCKFRNPGLILFVFFPFLSWASRLILIPFPLYPKL
jgi:hypothetical protein